jgi:hypothetical protein
MSKVFSLPLVLAALLAPALAAAQGLSFDSKKLYYGGGLGSNHVANSERAMGVQLFAGYPLLDFGSNLRLGAEAGLKTSGTMQRVRPLEDVTANAVQASAVGSYLLSPKFELLARGGYATGDRPRGVTLGGGLGFTLSPKLSLRLERIQRIDSIGSYEFNLVYRP